MRVESLSHHGLGRLADGTLVPRVLPGEEVEARPDGSWRVLTPSEDRVTAPCPHFARCGGCAVQHAADPYVAGWKAGIVQGALDGQGLGGEVGPVLTSPPHARRRARLAGRRLRRGALVGFHARASGEIVDVPRCQVVTPAILALLPALRDLVALAASRDREVSLTVTDAEGGLDVALDAGLALTTDLRTRGAAWAEAAGVARFTWNNEAVALRAPPWVAMGPARVVPPPGAFLQATQAAQGDLVAWGLAATAGAARVADLFAGCGTFALPLATRAAVHAVESDAAMLGALAAGWRGAGGLHRLTTEARDLFRRPLEPVELRAFDAVVLDPPRAGAEAQAAALAASAVPIVAYVSCSPPTFARDARILAAGGYRMGPVTVVDQFRWSAHVELAARFTRI